MAECSSWSIQKRASFIINVFYIKCLLLFQKVFMQYRGSNFLSEQIWDCIFQDKTTKRLAKGKHIQFPNNGLTICSLAEVSIPACTIKSFTFFCKSSIRLPISSSAMSRVTHGAQSTQPESWEKTLLQIAHGVTAPSRATLKGGMKACRCQHLKVTANQVLS